MSHVIVTAIFTPVPDGHDDLVGALRAGIPAVHAEEGCELYAIHDAVDGTIVMIERWTSAETLAAHAAGEAVAALNELIGPYLAQPVVVTTMTPLPAGDADKGAL